MNSCGSSLDSCAMVIKMKMFVDDDADYQPVSWRFFDDVASWLETFSRTEIEHT